MLDAHDDIRRLIATLEEYGAGRAGLEELQQATDEIIERWRVAEETDKPRFIEREIALWNVVWDISSSCKEQLARDAIAIHVQRLRGEIPLLVGGSRLRP